MKNGNEVNALSSSIFRPAAPRIVIALSSADLTGLCDALEAKKSFVIYGGEFTIEIERRTSYWVKRSAKVAEGDRS